MDDEQIEVKLLVGEGVSTREFAARLRAQQEQAVEDDLDTEDD